MTGMDCEDEGTVAMSVQADMRWDLSASLGTLWPAPGNPGLWPFAVPTPWLGRGSTEDTGDDHNNDGTSQR